MASAAIVEIFIVVGHMDKQSRNMAVATALAEQKIETYRDAGYNAIPPGTPAEDFSALLPANFGTPKSAVANVSTPQAGLKQVDVVISYTDDKRAKKIQLSTLVAQTGIDR